MSSNDLVLQMVRLFDRLEIPYMLVGSYSSNYYGRPRSTKDADFVLILEATKLSALQQNLDPQLHLDPQMSFESVTMTMRHIITHARWRMSSFRNCAGRAAAIARRTCLTPPK